MNDREIVEKAVRKAANLGWAFAGSNEKATIEVLYRDDYFGNNPFIVIDWHMPTELTELSVADVIFSHDFAKALWGKKPMRDANGVEGYMEPYENWQYHLQQMVIAEDPIRYLGENI